MDVNERTEKMEQKRENQNFAKVFGVFLGLVLLVTFFSKSIYNYQLPVVTISSPQQGNLSFMVEGTAEISYPYTEAVYADLDGRVKEILVQAGDEVQEGQVLMRFEIAGTGERKDVIAEYTGIVTAIGVKKGMYVSSMQNTILFWLAEKSEEWIVSVFLTEEQLEYADEESIVDVQVADTDEHFSGTIQSVVAYAGENETGYMANAIIVSNDRELAGKKAQVTIRKESEAYDTIIPAAAIRKDSNGYYALVLKEEDSVLGSGYIAHRMSVDLLNSDETYCAVRGLPTDETVIIASTSEITDGSKVYFEGEGAK